MEYSTFGRFLYAQIVVNAIALVIVVTVSPPDPFTTMAYYLPVVPIVVFLSYLLVYRGGFEYISEWT